MEMQLPDCQICQSELCSEIERKFRKRHKIMPIAVEYAPHFNRSVASLRKWLTAHFENLHRKYRLAQKAKEQEIVATLEDKGISFDDYRDRALKKAFLHLEDPSATVKPTDIAALENVAIAKQKQGLEESAFKLRIAQMYGGFLDKAVEGEVVVNESTRVLAEG